MSRLWRNNFRCAVAYLIKVGRWCDHGVDLELIALAEEELGRQLTEDEARLGTSWGRWLPTNMGKHEVRSCRECGRMEKREADHGELTATREEINS